MLELIKSARSYRRFHQEPVDVTVLNRLVDCARLGGSAANLQPLKYMIVDTPELNSEVFNCTAWAGYLRDWPGPQFDERPVAYIVILEDRTIAKNALIDVGIAAQNIVLAAAEQGIGACMIGSLKREPLRDVLGVASDMRIALVVALGYPAERIVLESVGDTGSVEYYRDENGVHHVPKRSFNEVVLTIKNR